MTSILVAGDLIRDHNLVRDPRAPVHHHETVPHTLLREVAGGAWYLSELVGLACSDLQPSLMVPDAGCEARNAYTIWSRYPRTSGEKPRAWRVEQFLGCEPREAAPGEPAIPAQDGVVPDLLVLDDLGLEFRTQPTLWPAVLRAAAAPPRSILLKTTLPLAEGALWDLLLERYADRLTVVLPAAALRARPADIAESLSWDLAIEQTVREVETGASALDLGRCRRVVVQFGGAGAACFTRRDGERALFERFLYLPEDSEARWNLKQPGQTFGALSLLTAALARHECDPAGYPLYIALGRGLAAVRRNHEHGGGTAEFDPRSSREELRRTFHPGPAGADPAAEYFTAFPHALLSDPSLRQQPAACSDLIRDLAGAGIEYAAAKATEVVLRGAKAALGAAPKASYGSYLTVDREEIERINSVRALILTYLERRDDRRPLSIAVFGPPGSGKSFAIKQLATELFGEKKAILECNLTQFASVEDLYTAFHRVRDACLLGQTPLVFWDEFDSGSLLWLKEFLAPMQDAAFQEGSSLHHLGRAVFVFAGGTCADFAQFDRSEHPDASVRKTFADLKGPDFVSRLRGSINIKGPNPQSRDDSAYLIRRALLLRAQLERHFPQLIDPDTQAAAISTSVVRGFLRAEKYLHGARSLENVVSSSTPRSRFDPGALPGPDVLKNHVSADFREEVAQGELELPVLEALAEACHNGWCKLRTASGWRYGAERDDAGKLHPLLRSWNELSEAQKELNRLPARLTQAKLLEVGYRITRVAPGASGPSTVTEFSPAERATLVRIEHDIWMRDRLLRGYAAAAVTNERLRLHRDIIPFDELPPEDRVLDEAIVDAIPETLRKRNYRLERA